MDEPILSEKDYDLMQKHWRRYLVCIAAHDLEREMTIDVCAKCWTREPIVSQLCREGKEFRFCLTCSLILSRSKDSKNMVADFLRDDYGEFPVHQIDKDRIDARRRRAAGVNIWKKD